jgi:hypothetical protein
MGIGEQSPLAESRISNSLLNVEEKEEEQQQVHAVESAFVISFRLVYVCGRKMCRRGQAKTAPKVFCEATDWYFGHLRRHWNDRKPLNKVVELRQSYAEITLYDSFHQSFNRTLLMLHFPWHSFGNLGSC